MKASSETENQKNPLINTIYYTGNAQFTLKPYLPDACLGFDRRHYPTWILLGYRQWLIYAGCLWQQVTSFSWRNTARVNDWYIDSYHCEENHDVDAQSPRWLLEHWTRQQGLAVNAPLLLYNRRENYLEPHQIAFSIFQNGARTHLTV